MNLLFNGYIWHRHYYHILVHISARGWIGWWFMQHIAVSIGCTRRLAVLGYWSQWDKGPAEQYVYLDSCSKHDNIEMIVAFVSMITIQTNSKQVSNWILCPTRAWSHCALYPNDDNLPNNVSIICNLVSLEISLNIYTCTYIIYNLVVFYIFMYIDNKPCLWELKKLHLIIFYWCRMRGYRYCVL